MMAVHCKTSFQVTAVAQWIIAMAVGSPFIAEEARAETQEKIAFSASTGFDSNPFLAAGKNREVAAFRLEMMPTIAHDDGLSQFRLAARAEHVEYLGKYKSAQNLGANLLAKHRIDERTEISATIAASSAISSTTIDALSEDLPPLAPGEGTIPITDDITILGRQLRRTTYSAEASLLYRPSDNDQLRWSSSARLQRYSASSGLNEYNFLAHRIDYSRRLNANVDVGVMTEVAIGDFRYVRFGDSRLISPQLTAKARLNERFDLSGSVGATFSRIALLQGNRKSTAFSGNTALCYREERSSFCVNGQRQIAPTAIGGLRKLTSVGTSYSLRLSSVDTLQSGVSYSRASEPLVGGLRELESIRIFGRVDRRLNERMRLFASTGYTDNFDELTGKRSNVQGLLGVEIRFGSLR
jgi:hypothetical protein